MRKKLIPYNGYFHIPFLLWVVCGGLLLLLYSKATLFAAINTRHTPLMDIVMYYITWMGQAEVIAPVLLLLFLLPGCRNIWYLMAASACNLVPLVLLQSLKSWFDAPRPLNYFDHAAWIHMLPNWPELMYRSFPSGHSEGAFSFFCFLALLLPNHHKKWGVLFVLLALAVCYSRVYLAAHFFEDVYVGSITGTVVTTLVFAVMKKYERHFFKHKENN